jgi:crossover junction endodeoxyribonuclease RuvC
MIILGIDPGTTRAGYGIIESRPKPKLIECGILKVSSKEADQRITEAAKHFRSLIKKYKPELVAVEKLFFVNNQKTGMAVAEMRGALRLLAGENNLPFFEFAPTEIKKTVTGFGGADKIAVHKMVCISLNIKNIPGPDDVSDALAVALTALYHKSFL